MLGGDVLLAADGSILMPYYSVDNRDRPSLAMIHSAVLEQTDPRCKDTWSTDNRSEIRNEHVSVPAIPAPWGPSGAMVPAPLSPPPGEESPNKKARQASDCS